VKIQCSGLFGSMVFLKQAFNLGFRLLSGSVFRIKNPSKSAKMSDFLRLSYILSDNLAPSCVTS
jgi:hypothetical protein